MYSDPSGEIIPLLFIGGLALAMVLTDPIIGSPFGDVNPCPEDIAAAQRAALAFGGLSFLIGPTGKIRITGEVLEKSVQWAIHDPNKLAHVFNDAGHGLESLLQKFGSQEAVIREILSAANGKFIANGVNEINITINGVQTTVRGVLSDGVFKIGTIFAP